LAVKEFCKSVRLIIVTVADSLQQNSIEIFIYQIRCVRLAETLVKETN